MQQSSISLGSGDSTVVGVGRDRAIEWRISHPLVGSRVVVVRRAGHGVLVRRDVGMPARYRPFDVSPAWFESLLDVVREEDLWSWRHTKGESLVAATAVLDLPPHVRCSLIIPEHDFGARGPRRLIATLEALTGESIVIRSRM